MRLLCCPSSVPSSFLRGRRIPPSPPGMQTRISLGRPRPPSFLRSLPRPLFPREIIINAEIGKQFVQKPNRRGGGGGCGGRGRHGDGVWNLALAIRFLEQIRFFSVSISFLKMSEALWIVSYFPSVQVLRADGGKGEKNRTKQAGRTRPPLLLNQCYLSLLNRFR